jgi:hypothetical protein
MHVHDHAGHAAPPLPSFLLSTIPSAQARHHASLHHPSPSSVEENDDSRRTKRAQNGIGMPRTSRACSQPTSPGTRRLAAARLPWTPSLRVEHRRRRANPPDTVPCPRAACRRRRRRHFPVDAATDTDAMRRHPTVPHLAITRVSLAWMSPT